LLAPASGAAYTLAGRVADAVPLLTRALEQTIAKEMLVYQVLCRLALSEAYLLASRPEEAQTFVEGALAFARARQERGHQACALRLIGEIAARREPPEVESAKDYYRQALALANEISMRPLIAHCHRGLGTLYAKLGRPEQERTEWSMAIELYRAMDMTLWLPEAEAMLAQGDVP
jgi:tetratricopeptide (TPR) repeat protein